MAKKDDSGVVSEKQVVDMEHIERRLNMLDQRLDNIDSTVSALVERVLNQPVTLNTTCPGCGKNIEIAIIGGHRLTG